MALLVWSDILSVKNEVIDNQHKILINIINKFYDNILNPKGIDITTDVLNELYEYSIYHFSCEEQIFRENNFYDLQNHLQDHARFVMTIIDFKTKLLISNKNLKDEIIDFVNDWLYRHVLEEDKKFKIQ